MDYEKELSTEPFRITACALCLIFCLALPVWGRDVGTSGSMALKIGVGAKPTGMGEACVAVADDVSSIYWNPAGLFQIRDSQLSAMHIEWLDDIRYEWVGYAQPVTSWATVAADVSYVHMGSISRTIESATEGYEQDGTFTAADMAGRFALAGKVTRDILVGASFQVFQSRVDFQNVTKERITDKIAQSTAVGLGGIYNTPVPNLRVGCSFQNWGRQTRAFFTEKEPLPFAFRLGVAYKKVLEVTQEVESSEEGEAVDSDVDSSRSAGVVLAAMDLNFPADGPAGACMGVEYQLANGIAVRGGYRTGTGLEFPSGICGGAGYSTATYHLDYAFVPYGDVGSTHRVSFTVKF